MDYKNGLQGRILYFFSTKNSYVDMKIFYVWILGAFFVVLISHMKNGGRKCAENEYEEKERVGILSQQSKQDHL